MFTRNGPALTCGAISRWAGGRAAVARLQGWRQSHKAVLYWLWLPRGRTRIGHGRAGHEVVGIDFDARKIEQLAAGKPPFYEPGLPEILTSAMKSGHSRPGHHKRLGSTSSRERTK
jgi:hypothetical protein